MPDFDWVAAVSAFMTQAQDDFATLPKGTAADAQAKAKDMMEAWKARANEISQQSGADTASKTIPVESLNSANDE